MSQVVATRSIHSSSLCPNPGSAQPRTENLLKPSTFAFNVFSPRKTSKDGFHKRSCQITARKSAPAPAEVVPVSLEDDLKIEEQLEHLRGIQQFGDTSANMWLKPTFRRKMKIKCVVQTEQSDFKVGVYEVYVEKIESGTRQNADTRRTPTEEDIDNNAMYDERTEKRKEEKPTLEAIIKDTEEESEAIKEEIWSHMEHLKEKHHRNEASVCILDQKKVRGRDRWFFLFFDMESVQGGVTSMDE